MRTRAPPPAPRRYKPTSLNKVWLLKDEKLACKPACQRNSWCLGVRTELPFAVHKHVRPSQGEPTFHSDAKDASFYTAE